MQLAASSRTHSTGKGAMCNEWDKLFRHAETLQHQRQRRKRVYLTRLIRVTVKSWTEMNIFEQCCWGWAKVLTLRREV